MYTTTPSNSAEATHAAPAARELYLELMKACLTNVIYPDDNIIGGGLRPFNAQARETGRDWPERGHTMVGAKRLDNVQFCVEDVLARGVPGDFIETGIWRGGVAILMRAVLKAHGVTDRVVWAADSFEGLPPPNAEKYPLDAPLKLHRYKQLAVSLEEVQENFRRYGLLDEQVRFLKGWFRDTLPTAPIERLAVLRLDGDLYESTMDALSSLYPKLELGGYVIVDDYNDIAACRQAVTDYRSQLGIRGEIVKVDWTGVYWKKQN
jgi:O-methyltransferase